MKSYITLFASLAFLIAQAQFTKYVNPFIGTGGHGHTFPGSVCPFGMVQLSPDTRTEGWDACSGYHSTDSTILGFSHTHLSGTGIADYCDILIMPGTGFLNSKNIEDGKYPNSRFSKNTEVAKAGFYQVLLENSKTLVKLTTTPRTGVHEYHFQSNENNWFVVDLRHRDKVIQAGFNVILPNEIGGTRVSSSWSKNQKLYFDLKTSTKIDRVEFSKDSLVLFCFFKMLPEKTLKIQCAISSVDLEGAQRNLIAEWVNFNFKKAYENCDKMWNNLLSRIQIVKPHKEDYNKLIVFYSALYHCLIHPSLAQDADGRYLGMDSKIHKSYNKTQRFTVFSLWDTYRAAHPLYQLIYPDYNKQFVHTFLEQFNESERLPVWELSSYETYCMIGNHSIPVLANYLMQNEKVDTQEKNLIVHAIEKTLQAGYSNIKNFRNGFISMDESSESVSKTIENAVDFGALSAIIKRDLPEKYFYKNLFNPKTGFFQAKISNKFWSDFDPREVNFNYTEANAWQYLFGAHHDVEGIMDCLSISDKINHIKNSRLRSLESKLDELFGGSSQMNGRVQADITGLIGQYAHGNEPSHHVAYLFNYCNRNDKTQKLVQQIIDSFYSNKPDGLCGNEDCGQMSAWYVFSSLGFYPVNPITGKYQPGRPQFEKVNLYPKPNHKISLQCNKKEGIKWVNKIYKNKKEIKEELNFRNGDVIEYVYSDNNSLEVKVSDKPDTKNAIVLPYIESGDEVFKDSTYVVLASLNDRPIEYCLDTFERVQEYKSPICIKEQKKLFFRTKESDSKKINKWLLTEFQPKPDHFKYTVVGHYDSQYSAGGNTALADGRSGSSDFRDGRWQGYWGQDIIIDLEVDGKMDPKEISISCLQDQGSWILLPSKIDLYVENQSGTFIFKESLTHHVPKDDLRSKVQTFKSENIRGAKRIQLKIRNSGKLPSWHESAGNDSWLFIDEIKLK